MRLPPLNALKAFEVAARLGGYAAAGAELGVSPAAVSQQVRNLEHFYGKRLFDRYNNRVVLTEAGREIQAGAAEGLRRIAEMSDHVLTGASRTRLRISAPPSIVERWLAPRLAQFAMRKSEVHIEVRVADDPLDFAAEGLDLRICFGARLYPDLDVSPLFEDQVAPMASAGFISRYDIHPGSDLSELGDAYFIQTNWGPSFATHPTWGDWFRHKGRHRSRDVDAGLSAGSSSLALELARLGLGVALVQIELAQQELASDALVRLDPGEMPIGHPYCAVTQPGRRKRASVETLLEVLRNSSRNS